jgi:hypothetical protein
VLTDEQIDERDVAAAGSADGGGSSSHDAGPSHGRGLPLDEIM